jgi:hypothetical protein
MLGHLFGSARSSTQAQPAAAVAEAQPEKKHVSSVNDFLSKVK